IQRIKKSKLFPYTTLFRSLKNKANTDLVQDVISGFKNQGINCEKIGLTEQELKEQEEVRREESKREKERLAREKEQEERANRSLDRKSTRLNSSHLVISYA